MYELFAATPTDPADWDAAQINYCREQATKESCLSDDQKSLPHLRCGWCGKKNVNGTLCAAINVDFDFWCKESNWNIIDTEYDGKCSENGKTLSKTITCLLFAVQNTRF